METNLINEEILTDLFEGIESNVKKFKRDGYAAQFEDFLMQKKPFLDAIRNILADEDKLDETAYQDISKEISESFQNLLNKTKSKGDKLNLQLNANLYMAVYVLPAINSFETKEAKKLTETICSVWSSKFKDSEIKPSTFETISAGFRKKLCYITTAVCESLHKGPDCAELSLIKEFRDSYLEKTLEGKKLVEEYYNIAPTIVKRINKSENAEETYQTLWQEYLSVCVENIRNNDPESCKKTYCDMVEELQNKYMGGQYEQS